MDKQLEKDLNTKRAIKIEDLLKKKDLIKSRFNATVDIETELGIFTFRVPTRDDVKDASDFSYNKEEMEDEMLIYSCSVEPNLRSKELQELKEDENDHPVMVVRSLFLQGEIGMIATRLIKKAGFSEDSARIVEDTKN